MRSTGTIAGSVRKDRCVRFSGSGYVAHGTGGSFNFERTDSFSLYHWCRWSQASAAILGHREGEVNSRKGWAQFLQSSGAVAFVVRNANSANQLALTTTATGFNDSKWHSIVSTYAGTSTPAGVHIYVDNVDQALTTNTNNLNATIKGTFNLETGRDVIQASQQYTGDCGGFAIFSGVISSGDRAVLHNSRKGPPAPAAVLALANLLGYWRMGNGNVYPTVDDEVSTIDGTLTGLSAAAMQAYGPPYA